jgi:hypothetical protein
MRIFVQQPQENSLMLSQITIFGIHEAHNIDLGAAKIRLATLIVDSYKNIGEKISLMHGSWKLSCYFNNCYKLLHLRFAIIKMVS